MQSSTSTHVDAPASPLTLIAKIVPLLLFTGMSMGLWLALWSSVPMDTMSFWDNQLSRELRAKIFTFLIVGASAFPALFAVYGVITRKQGDVLSRQYALGLMVSPLACTGPSALLFRWQLWEPRPLAFCVAATFFALAVYLSVKASVDAGIARTRPLQFLGALFSRFRDRYPRVADWLPFGIVVAASTAYVAYFAYHTICFHLGVWTGFDTGIKHNIFWNTLHGSPFKASPTMGPDGPSHFGLHADLLVYVLLPFYWLHQKTETILFFQALFAGGAGVALYAVLIRYVRPWVAAFLVVCYLLHPALAAANIFEFHFTLFGLPLLWGAWASIERRRYILAGLFVLLTLLTREDISFWVVIMGLYFVVSGRNPKAGAITTAVGMAFFVVIKFIVMPRYSGGESFTFVYDGLMPDGEHSFAGAIKTVFVNPAHLVASMLREDKLIYILQIFLPLLFLPWRRSIFVLLAIPGFLITLLPPRYTPVFSLYFQYSPHWLAFLFPAAAMVLADESPEKRRLLAPRIAAIACATLLVSNQYGAILQQHTAWAGPRKFRFGFTEESRQRRRAMDELMALIPPRAKVASSSVGAPQFTSRPDAYDMNQGWFDAEYVVIPTPVPDFIANERQNTIDRLNDGSFGVVQIAPPFALIKKGHSTERNGELLNLIR